jgi:hypothetical protein
MRDRRIVTDIQLYRFGAEALSIRTNLIKASGESENSLSILSGFFGSDFLLP